ncbi:hypothetical protein [Chondromyces crocatus]|uniref:hypothetical protein n=1 Tax=Chondromyces crocatus TaxID=52 RepID=UPI0012E1AFAD|nr:hypothetical protein [Chondromyces crocatus]
MAQLARGHGEPATVTLWLSRRGQTHAWRRPLAFARLASALGARTVPSAVLRRIPVGDVARLLEGQPGGPELLRELVVMNDGSVDALVQGQALGTSRPLGAPRPPSASCTRRIRAVDGAAEMEQWSRWAASLTPLAEERTQLVRDYVEMLVLDYLSGHIRRPDLLLDVDGDALILDDNADAFPALVPVHALDLLLRRLAAVERFPRTLHAGLLQLGRAQMAAHLAPGSIALPTREVTSRGGAPSAPAPLTGFDQWLVSPRTLIDLDERRLALLSLIEAKRVRHGEAALGL